jgi:hypothetical protein
LLLRWENVTQLRVALSQQQHLVEEMAAMQS